MFRTRIRNKMDFFSPAQIPQKLHPLLHLCAHNHPSPRSLLCGHRSGTCGPSDDSLPELWPGSLCCHPVNRLLSCFSLGGIFQKLQHRHKVHTHSYTLMHTALSVHGKSKQELSGCSEPCLMQQDERCCRVVENWSL